MYRDGQCWLGDDPLLSHPRQIPGAWVCVSSWRLLFRCPGLVTSPGQCGHTPGPPVSARVTGLCLMTNVNILNVKHNVRCCPIPFEWWMVHERQNMSPRRDVKLSPIRKCLMLNDWGLCLSGPGPGKHRRGHRGRVSRGNDWLVTESRKHRGQEINTAVRLPRPLSQ